MKPVVTMEYYTGMRKGEILRLQWSRVDLIEGKITLKPQETKNKEARTVYTEGELLEAISFQKALKCTWVFFGENGEPVSDVRGATQCSLSEKGDVPMFGNLLERLRNATNPFKGFLGELWTIWKRDAGRAVLLARWSWENLPEELVQQAAAVQQQAQAAQAASQINQQVNLQLGSMGIFPGSAGGPSFGFGMNPDHAMFIMIMGMIRAHRGDPPTSQEMAQLAEAVLRGQMDPVDAMIAAAPPFARQQLVAAAQMLKMTGMYQLLRLQAIIQVASSLPRERIPVLVSDVERT